MILIYRDTKQPCNINDKVTVFDKEGVIIDMKEPESRTNNGMVSIKHENVTMHYDPQYINARWKEVD